MALWTHVRAKGNEGRCCDISLDFFLRSDITFSARFLSVCSASKYIPRSMLGRSGCSLARMHPASQDSSRCLDTPVEMGSLEPCASESNPLQSQPSSQ